MSSIIEIIIYIIAIIGIFLTYISFKDNEEICGVDYVENQGVKKVEIVIKTFNFNEEEKNIIVEKIKNGDYANILEIVDKIKIESDNW